jgi:hypothetical protein
MRFLFGAAGAGDSVRPRRPVRPRRERVMSFVRLECDLTRRAAPQLHR